MEELISDKKEVTTNIQKGQILIILSALAWGSSFPTIKWGLSFIHPAIFVFFRFLPASFMIILFIPFFGSKSAFCLLKDKRIIFLGLINALGYLLEFIGMVYTTAGKASLLVNINIIIVAIFSFYLLGESINWKKISAIAISIIGVILITTDGNLEALISGSFMGDIIVICGGVVWSIYIVYSKKILNEKDKNGKEFNSVNLTTAVILMTTIFLFGPAIFYSLYDPLSIVGLFTLPAIFAVLYTGFICTTLAFTLYYAGLKYISASTSAIILLLEIVFAVLLSFIFLAEIPTFYTIIGGVFIGVAIYLATK